MLPENLTAILEVETGGLLTTVQDLGRTGGQRSGMTVAGAMDPFAAATANLLVGNPRRAAVLEITLVGPTLRFLEEVSIALCGGDLSAQIDNDSVPLWTTARVSAGQRLRFGRRRSGARAYLAVSGGLHIPEIGGSRATFLRGKIGGCEGRSFRSGDVLTGSMTAQSVGGRGLPRCDQSAYKQPAILRVLPGPHRSQFTERGYAALLGETYTLSPQSDRQGYRLSGPPIERTGLGDILSEPMPLGGIQIPPDCQPILLMADRQPTGGYPLIGVVISADIPRAAQLAPGDQIRFAPVGLADAAADAITAERRLRLLELVCRF